MNSSVIAVVGSLGGVLLGFLLQGTGALLRRRHEDTCRLRRALYGLLNLYHMSTPPNLKEMGSIIHNWVESKDPGVARTMTSEDLCQKIQEIIPILISPIRQESLRIFGASYEKTVDEIAEVDPLLAFTLSGKSRVQTDVRQYTDSLNLLLNPEYLSENGSADASQLIGAMKDYFDTQFRDVLLGDINAVAKRLSFRTRYRVSKLIKRMQGESDPELKRSIIAYLDAMLLSLSKSKP